MSVREDGIGGQVQYYLNGPANFANLDCDGYNDPQFPFYFSDATCLPGMTFPPIPGLSCPDCADPLACNFNPMAEAGNFDACLYVSGCGIPGACNYEPNVCNDSSVCVYPGCTDPAACNYDPNAGCDDGSCIAVTAGQTVVSGLVYFDANNNGVYNSGVDWPIAGGEVHVQPANLIAFANAQGQYSVGIPWCSGQQTLTFQDAGGNYLPHPTTGSANLNVINQATAAFNLGAESTSGMAALVLTTSSGFSSQFHCNFGWVYQLKIKNTGTVALTGSAQLILDPTLVASDVMAWPTTINPSSYAPGLVSWDLAGHQPGQIRSYKCFIAGPGVGALGSVYAFNTAFQLIDGLGAEIYAYSSDFNKTVICAYDPNDKLAEPEGYAQPHFILADQELEYVVRFQNTGNFPAEYITVVDSLATDYFDLSTFVPVHSSHSMQTCLDLNSGIAQFKFPDIMLPDSTSDEPGSHGYLVYRIKPLPGIEPGAVINNTAYIYFEVNPPIITNTTWHTIFDCAGLAEFSVSDELPCEGTEFAFESVKPYIESYSWTINGAVVGSENSTSFVAPAGTHEVQLHVSNPLCEESEIVTVLVNPAPDAVIIADGAVLSAGSGAGWQWFLNGTAIDGAMGQTFNAEESGLYTVLVTNEFGCSDMSEGVLVTSVGEHAKMNLLLYPNPMTDRAMLVLGAGMWSVEVYDASGRKVRGYERVTDRLEIMKGGLAAGSYTLLVRGEDGDWGEVLMVVE